MKRSCPECGFPLNGNERDCPECGFPLQTNNKSAQHQPPAVPATVYVSEKKDWANYIYECGVIMWNVFCHKFAKTRGRASRKEFWSFTIITTCLMPLGLTFILFIPWLCVSIRRMHDINRCGWWILVPFACFFMYLKKSDEGENKYGLPNPAKNMVF